MPKYRNVRTNGYASKKESNRAAELALLQKLGEITNLEEQVKFVLIPQQDGERSVSYIADFCYRTRDGNLVVEDTKGFRTREYIIKRKLMLYIHHIKVKEI